MNDKNTRIIISAAMGIIAISILVALLTIIGEEYAPLKNWLKNTFSHHWLGKSALSMIVFVLGSAIMYPFSKNSRVTRVLWVSLIFAFLSAFSVSIYFLLHTLHIV